jgi:hypothetical protein
LGKIEGFAAFAVLEFNVLILGEVRDIFERFFGKWRRLVVTK